MNLPIYFTRLRCFLALLFLLAATAAYCQAATTDPVMAQIRELQLKVFQLEAQQNGGMEAVPALRPEKEPLDSSVPAGVAFLFGAFCALWAQNTGRSAWLWFFLGAFFNVVAVIVLLVKNANDRKRPNPRLFSEGRKIGA